MPDGMVWACAQNGIDCQKMEKKLEDQKLLNDGL
jgi:hypothetical protein